MNEWVHSEEEVRAALEAKDQRIRELERHLAEAEANLQAVISQQVDAVISPEGTVPLLLHQAQQAMQRSNEELEQRVAQRTAELMKELDTRRQIEAHLWESEERFRTVWEISTDALALSDPDGTVTAANPAYCQLYGYSPEEVLGQNFAVIFPDELRAWARQQYQEVFTNPIIPPRFESTIQRKDGQQRVVETEIAFIMQNGQRQAMLSVIRDISERKRMEETLSVSEEHFQVALKNSPMVVYTTDQELRYTWIYNPAFGFDPAQMLGKIDEELNEPENVAELTALKQSVISSGVGKRQEILLVYQGEIFHYDVTVEPIRGDRGEVTGLTVAAIDITETRRLQQARLKDQVQIELQRQLMVQRELERQQIARDIHDGPIQTLVSAIFNLQVTKEVAERAVADQALQIEFNQIGLSIKTAVQELREVVNELRPPSLLRFGLAKTIRIHAEDLQEKHPRLEILLEMPENHIQMPEQTSLTLFRIYQEALNNVVRHAEATHVCVRLACVEAQVLLEVEDNGKGFLPVSDLTGQTASGHYGLAGMIERAEAVGGHFHIRSSPGKGTTIQVEVPINI